MVYWKALFCQTRSPNQKIFQFTIMEVKENLKIFMTEKLDRENISYE